MGGAQVDDGLLEMINFKCSDDVVVQLSRKDCEHCETLKEMLINASTHEDDDIIPLSTLSSKDMKGLKTWFSDNTLPTTINGLLQSIVVANFLEVNDLLSAVCKTIREMVSDKVPSQLKMLFEGAESTKSDHHLRNLLSFEQEPYNGQDPSLQIDRRTCFISCDNPTSPGHELMVCTGCRLMKYCSKDCQKEDWPSHKEHCKVIQKNLKKVEKERMKLLHEEGVNVFEVYMGHLWGNPSARDYCRARLFLADSYLSLAHEEEHASMYEAGLKHYFELQRLIRGDNMGLRDKTPFILINLNRDDDAYNFVKHWLTVDEDWYCEPMPFEEGVWMYLEGENRFEDPSVITNKYSSLANLVALLILKLRIIAKHVADLQQFKIVWELIEKDGRWQALTDMRNILKTHLVGDKKYFTLMEEQRQHIDFLFSAIAGSNSIFLKAVVNPERLRSQPYPSYHSSGSAEEAYLVLNDCCRIFYRLPGAIKRIKGFLGADTDYDPAFSNW